MNIMASERKRLGLSQGDIAQKLNCNRSTVIRWESDPTSMKGSTLMSLASLFGCSVDYLLGRTDERLPRS